MEKIEAIIMPFKLDELKRALSDAGFVSMTISEVYDSGRQNGQSEMYRGREFTVDFLPKLKVEVVVPDERADAVVSLICRVSKTGSIGDGRVFVSSLKDVIGIRPGEHGERAIGEDPKRLHGRPISPGLPVDVVRPTGIARDPDSKRNDVEKIMATALPSLADYLVAERPGRVYREIIAIMERPLFAHVLGLTDGNQSRAAHLLGLNRNTFHSRCRQYGLLSSAQPKNNRADGTARAGSDVFEGARVGLSSPS